MAKKKTLFFFTKSSRKLGVFWFLSLFSCLFGFNPGTPKHIPPSRSECRKILLLSTTLSHCFSKTFVISNPFPYLIKETNLHHHRPHLILNCHNLCYLGLESLTLKLTKKNQGHLLLKFSKVCGFLQQLASREAMDCDLSARLEEERAEFSRKDSLVNDAISSQDPQKVKFLNFGKVSF